MSDLPMSAMVIESVMVRILDDTVLMRKFQEWTMREGILSLTGTLNSDPLGYFQAVYPDEHRYSIQSFLRDYQEAKKNS